MPVVAGRLLLPSALLPADIVSELEKRAKAAGVDPADRRGDFARFLGDLVAAELPAAIAEVASDLLGRGLEAEHIRRKNDGPRRQPRTVSSGSISNRSLAIVPAWPSDLEPSGDDSPS